MNIVDTNALFGSQSLLFHYDQGASYTGGWTFIVGPTPGLPGDLTPSGGCGYVEMNWFVMAPAGGQDWLQAGFAGPGYYSVAQ